MINQSVFDTGYHSNKNTCTCLYNIKDYILEEQEKMFDLKKIFPHDMKCFRIEILV